VADTSLVFNILARDKASKAFDKVKAAAAAAFAVGATAAVAFGKSALSAGAELSAAMGATNQVFGESAATVLEWSKTTADAFGIARSDALAAAKDFGAFFTAIGMSAPAAADLSKEWVAMSANLAAFRDVDPTQALEAMQSALRGELDPIQQFIPSINAAAIEQRALAMTGKQAASELTQQEKALALNALMMESVANQAGAAELAQNGFGVQSAKLQAKLKDTSAEIGEKLLPYALRLTEWALGAINWMKEHEGLVKAIVGVLGGFAAIIGTIIAITKIWTIVQTALNVVMALNPIGLIIIAIAALIAIIVLIATKTDWFQRLWKTVWGAIKGAAEAVGRWFRDTLWPWIRDVWDKIKNGVTGVKDWIVQKWDQIIGFFRNLPGRIRSAVSGMWDGIKNAFRNAINWIISKWNNFSISLPGVNIPGLGRIGGFTLNTPNIPLLAQGGIVPATPGGRLILAGEGREDEAVAPLSRLATMIRDAVRDGNGGPDVLRLELDLGHDIRRVIEIDLRRRDRTLRRRAMAGAGVA